MANFQNFRSAFHGFNRQDVVNYIEYMNQKHRSEVEQLNNQLRAAKEEIVALKAAVPHEDGISGDTELEAYRRAERAERRPRSVPPRSTSRQTQRWLTPPPKWKPYPTVWLLWQIRWLPNWKTPSRNCRQPLRPCRLSVPKRNKHNGKTLGFSHFCT